MKLLKLGKVRKTKCPKCKSKYEFEPKDIDWYTGLSGAYVKCPVCEYKKPVFR